MTKYQFQVEMTCEGCSNAMNKILSRQRDKGEVDDFTVDLPTKTVNVTTTKELQEVVAMLEKAGKKVSHLKTEQ